MQMISVVPNATYFDVQSRGLVMRYLGILICFLLFLAVGSPVAAATVETLIFENFEDDAVGSKPPKNEGQPGTWQPGCEIRVGATKPSEPSN